MEILVDSNVILDFVTEDKRWFSWPSRALEHFAENHILVINPIIYAEVSVSFERIEDLEEVLSPACFRRNQLPWEAGFLAGKCFRDYRRKGRDKRSPLPDFFIELTPLLPNSHY